MRRAPSSTGLVLRALDAVVVLAAGWLTGIGSPWSYVAAASAAAVVAVGPHRSRLVPSVLPEVPVLLVASAVATAVLVAAGAVDGAAACAAYVVCAVGLLLAAHALVQAGVRLMRRTGRLRRRVVVVGCGPAARRVATALVADPRHGLEPVGFVRSGREDVRGLPLTLLGEVDALPRALAEAGAEAVVVAPPALSGPAVHAGAARVAATAAVEGCLAARVDVYATTRHLAALGDRLGAPVTQGPPERVGDDVLVRVRPRGRLDPVRRLVEVAGTVAALALLTPVLVLLAVPVALETGGVLEAGVRPDGEGRSRTVWLYRTRRIRSVSRRGTTWSAAVSGRLGPVGRALRRTRAQELPEVAHRLLERLTPGLQPLPTPPSPDEPQVDAGQLTQ